MTPLPLADLERPIGLPKHLASQRSTLEKLEAVMDRSLAAIKDVVWALTPTGACCPAWGARSARAGGGG